MSIINLIPPKIKRGQYVKKIAGIVFSSLFVATLIIVITFVAMYGINFYLESALIEAKQELSEAETKVASLKSVEDDVNDINAKIKKIDGIKSDNINWEVLINDFNSSVPDQVKIDTLSIDWENQTMSLSGVGETRREIVKLQEKLNASEYFANLGFSTSAYSDSYEAYSFSMTGAVNNE